jgi:hypothetical protein
VTNKGNRSPKYGGNGGGYHLLTLPDGFRIIGIHGRSSSRLEHLGFVIAKTEYNSITNKYETIEQNIILNDQ